MNWLINKENDYLKVVVHGEFDLREIEAIFKDVVKACQDTCCRCVLVDTRQVTGRITIMDRHRIGMLVVEYNKNYYKVAFVSSEENMLASRYLETVINNRWIPVLVTVDYQQAEQWLAEMSDRGKTQMAEQKSLHLGEG